MLRRTFIATLPALAAAPVFAWRGPRASVDAPPGPGQGGAPLPGGLPPRWNGGEARFVRPDVGPGDRPELARLRDDANFAKP